MAQQKSTRGNFFEDFHLGQELRHGAPRTLTEGDASVYASIFPTRFAPNISSEFAKAIGYPQLPLDDLLVFHAVFGKSVSDISLNAVANLGYAECQFLAPVYPGDTLSASSTVIGLKENSNGQTGVVYVRTIGRNEKGSAVVSFVRWVMVNKRDPKSKCGEKVIPELRQKVDPAVLGDGCPPLYLGGWEFNLSGSRNTWSNYEVGEKIDHIDGVTVEESEHQMATRLFNNTARVHFNAFLQKSSRFQRRLIYGGHVISMARALSYNGLQNAFHIAAINAGQHVNPLYSKDTIFCWSEILEMAELPNRSDIGAMRVRTIATKDRPCDTFPYKTETGGYHPCVLLDLDYWAIIPRV